jgi:PhzF family phenazine biosynthesis protein
MTRRFKQVDVFSEEPLRGNPVAVILDAEGLTVEEMQRLANWTNLSETTFVTAPTQPGADYAVRIFTTDEELPFAGHPTLGTCHAWLEAGGEPAGTDIVQECAAGLIPIRRIDGRLGFRAPERTRSGPPDAETLAQVTAELGVEPVAAEWCVNGPRWLGLLLSDADAVLAVQPRSLSGFVGLAGVRDGGDTQLEVRAFFPTNGATGEDPVTGSLNAALAQWLVGAGRLTAPYVAAQGTALGRRGRVHVSQQGEDFWIAGTTSTVIDGTVS